MSTVIHYLKDWADVSPSAEAQRFKKHGQWQSFTSREFCDRVFYLALFLESKGFKPKDVISIFSYNRPEWVQMDLAPHLLGGLSAGLYPNASSKDVHYVLGHTDSKILAVQDKEYYQRITGKNNEKSLPDKIELIIVFDDDTSFSDKAVAFSQAIEEGKKLAQGKKLSDYLDKMDKNAGAFLIYTSGTTGNPKGAILSHDNLVFTSQFIMDKWEMPATGSMFSFLPLCHIAEKLQNIGVGILSKYTVNYCSAFENLAPELAEVQPSLLLCVPRLWEKMMEGVEAKLKHAPPLKLKLARWAMATVGHNENARLNGKSLGLSDLLMEGLANKIVISKVRQAMGLGHPNVLCASGAAALSPTVNHWFRGLGVSINECYGQTETTGVICMTHRGKDCSGTVGVPAPGVECKLADDGEILTKGRHVFIGYLKNDEATKETIVDGWVHTGDLGKKTEAGYIKINGRKKEIMKTSGGKMVAPLPIEEGLKASPVISQVCMVGDGKKYFTALITLSEGLIAELKKSGASNGEVKDEKILADVKKQVDEINSTLAGYEKVKYFTVLPDEFSIDKGEMTPTLKMKRNVIENNYRDVIEKMYN